MWLTVTNWIYFSHWPPRAARFQSRPPNETSRPQTSSALPMESRCCIATVNKFLSTSPSSIIRLSQEKRTPRHRCSALLTLRIQTPDCDQPKKSCCSAPLVKEEIHQRLVYLLFPHARKGQSVRIIAHCPSGTQWKPRNENNIIHILNSWHQTEGTLHWGANYSTSQGSCSKPQ